MRVPKTDWRVVENWKRLRAQARLAKTDGVRNPTGLKRMYVPGSEYLEGNGIHTPFFARLKRKRRATRRVAHESRRRNR